MLLIQNFMSLHLSLQDGKTMYFTRNNYLDGKLGKKMSSSLLKLYKSTLIDGKMVKYSCAAF
jgi:hypothetical protein